MIDQYGQPVLDVGCGTAGCYWIIWQKASISTVRMYRLKYWPFAAKKRQSSGSKAL